MEILIFVSSKIYVHRQIRQTTDLNELVRRGGHHAAGVTGHIEGGVGERKDINMKYHSAFYVNRKGYLILILGSCTYMVDMVDMIW